MLDNLMLGFSTALTFENLLWCFLGVLVGTVIGLMPGLGSTTGIAILIPLTLGMEPVTALIMLAGIYYGAQYGGTITSVLISTPGEAASVVTTLDGYQMARQGRAGALVGQSGEFSFVLASTGLALGAVRPDSFSLAMGAVVISIVTAEPLLAVAKRLGDALEARATSPEVPDEGLADGLRRHAVILGYGRVGHAVARVLEDVRGVLASTR